MNSVAELPETPRIAPAKPGWPALLLLPVALLALAFAALAARPVGQVANLINEGRFAAAETAIETALAEPGIEPELARAYSFERERMRRILIDFPYTREQIQAQVRKHIPNLTDAEFEAWDQAGLFEHMVIDGRRVYFDRAASNLFRISPAALARRDPRLGPLREGPLERPHPHHALVRLHRRAGRRPV